MSDAGTARVTTVVAVDPATAFSVFTSEVDAWWRRGPRFRVPDDHRLCFDGDRFVAYRESGEVREMGRVLEWKPGERLLFTFCAASFEADQSTEVEIRFEARDGGGTRVTLLHRGWDTIPDDAPARRGLVGDAFIRSMGLWWADLLVSLRARCT